MWFGRHFKTFRLPASRFLLFGYNWLSMTYSPGLLLFISFIS